jgi:uncharacterized protein HemX
MIEEKIIVAKTNEAAKPEKLNRKFAEMKKFWLKKPSLIAVLLSMLLVAVALIYGYANGYFQASLAKPEHRAYDLKNKAEELQSEIAELSKQKARLEQKRSKILKQLEKTSVLLEKSKDSAAEVKAHIEVESSACMSCPTPAWIQSQRKIFAALEEIEKILNEEKTDEPAK